MLTMDCFLVSRVNLDLPVYSRVLVPPVRQVQQCSVVGYPGSGYGHVVRCWVVHRGMGPGYLLTGPANLNLGKTKGNL